MSSLLTNSIYIENIYEKHLIILRVKCMETHTHHNLISQVCVPGFTNQQGTKKVAGNLSNFLISH